MLGANPKTGFSVPSAAHKSVCGLVVTGQWVPLKANSAPQTTPPPEGGRYSPSKCKDSRGSNGSHRRQSVKVSEKFILGLKEFFAGSN